MAVATLAEVQQWLERTKVKLDALDGQLEETARLVTFSSLAAKGYDISDWGNENSTPELVTKVVSLRYAGWHYKRIYSEEVDEAPYGDYLLGLADMLTEGIISGAMDLEEVPGLAASSGPASFYPDADTGRVQQRDDSGYAIGTANSSAAKFRIGDRF